MNNKRPSPKPAENWFAPAAPSSWLLIDKLVLDPAFQVRNKLDEGAIERYAQLYSSGRSLNPIQVAEVDGLWIVTDGWHRLEALKRIGHTQAEALVTPMSRDDALWKAGEANVSHGVPLKRIEQVNVFKLYVRAGRHIKRRGKAGRVTYKSYREIARELPFPRSYGTVRNWMMKHFPSIARQMSDAGVPTPEGGLRDANLGAPVLTGFEKLTASVMDQFQSLSRPEDRAELVSAVRALLIRLETAAGIAEEPKAPF